MRKAFDRQPLFLMRTVYAEACRVKSFAISLNLSDSAFFPEMCHKIS